MKKPSVPELTRVALTSKAQELIESKFRHNIELNAPAARKYGFNYVVDIYTSWRGRYFYIVAKYCSPRTDAADEFFEVRNPRMEYVRNNRFNLAYMRHTGKWFVVYRELSMEACLEKIEKQELFWPIS